MLPGTLSRWPHSAWSYFFCLLQSSENKPGCVYNSSLPEPVLFRSLERKDQTEKTKPNWKDQTEKTYLKHFILFGSLPQGTRGNKTEIVSAYRDNSESNLILDVCNTIPYAVACTRYRTQGKIYPFFRASSLSFTGWISYSFSPSLPHTCTEDILWVS